MATKGRLPMDYGEQNEIKANNTKEVTNDSKTNAAGSPKGKANQEEGPAGRTLIGSKTMGVKMTDFNTERAKDR
jgi:hypothetical protein